MNTGGTVTLVIFLLLLAGAAAFAGWWFWRKKTKTRRELYAANKSGETNCHIGLPRKVRTTTFLFPDWDQNKEEVVRHHQKQRAPAPPRPPPPPVASAADNQSREFTALDMRWTFLKKRT